MIFFFQEIRDDEDGLLLGKACVCPVSSGYAE
jgi:hypothetical protein